MAERLRGSHPLLLPTVLGFAAYGTMVVVDLTSGTLRASSTPITVALMFVAFCGYLLTVWRAERSQDIGLRLLWIAPIVFRVLLLVTEPTLSDDVYRYLWDGHVLSNGVNPYSYAIDSPALDRLDIPIRALANNTNLSSPYLPTLQLLFAALSLFAPSDPLVIQLVMTGFDIGAAWLIYRLLSAADLPTTRVALYLWNPLVIVESAHGAHFDALMTFLLLAAVLAAVRPARSATSPLFLALATLTRPIPGLVAPVLWWRWSTAQRVWFIAVLACAVVPFGFGVSGWGLAGEPTGDGVFGSARIYSTEFRFNAIIAGWLERTLKNVETFSTVTGVLMLLVLAGVFVVARPANAGDRGTTAGPDEVRRILRLMTIPLITYVMLTPVFHPWYLVSVLAVCVFLTPGPGEGRSGWFFLAPVMYLSATAPLSYLTYRDPENYQELDWVRRLEWFPTILLLVIAVVIAIRSGSHRARDLQPSG